ncbi:MAG: hypothetical protein ACE14L_06870, partial [Terriglobales bacterium]
MACRSLFVFALMVFPISDAFADKPGNGPSPKASKLGFATYWTVEPGWQSELELRNNLAKDNLTIQPVLYTSEGVEIPLAAVNIPPNEIRTVDLGAALSATAPTVKGPNAFGSVVLKYTAHSELALYAAVMVHREGLPIAFHFDSERINPAYQEGGWEGIWWWPNETADSYVILANSSGEPLALTVRVSDSTGKSSQQAFGLGPHQTRKVSVRELVSRAQLDGSYGGIQISTLVKAGDLHAAQISYDETNGFSALMKLFDHDPSARSEHVVLRAPMVALGNPDPVLNFPSGTSLAARVFVRNTLAKELQAQMVLNWRSQSDTSALTAPPLLLKPGETRLINLGQLGVPAEANWAGVSVEYDGKSGDLI